MQFGSSYKKYYGYGATNDYTHGVIPDHIVTQPEAMDYAIAQIMKRRELDYSLLIAAARLLVM